MATAQLQHYVPRFLLRRFGSGKKDRVHVFDKHADATFCSAATKLAAINNFYDFEFMETPMTVESVLSRVESKAAKHISNIVKNCQLSVDDPIERGELAAFLAIQMVRTPARSAMHRDIFTQMEDWLRANGAAKDFFKPDPAVGEGENAERAMIARDILNAPINYAPALIDKDWLLLQTDSKYPYLIGDHPLTLHNMVVQEGRGNLGVGVEGIEIYFPLSPDLALAIWCPSHRQFLVDAIQRFEGLTEISSSSMKNFSSAKDNALKIVEAIQTGKPLWSEPENVEFFNSLQIATAERFVFSSNDNFSLVKDMVRTNPELRHGRRMPEATGKF
jgi:hypothetical protein